MKSLKQHDTYNILHVFTGILKRLPSRKRALAWVILGGMILAAILETITIGLTALFVAVLTDPATVINSPKLNILHPFLTSNLFIKPGSLVLFVGGLVLGIVIFKNIVKATVTYSYQRFSGFAGSYIGEQMFNLLMTAPYEWHLNKNSADLVLGVFWRQFFGKILNAVLEILSDCFMVVIILILLFVMEPVASALVFLILGGCSIIIFINVKKHLDRTLEKLKDYRQTINKEVTQAIHGIKDVRVFGRERYFRSKYTNKAYTEARIEAKQMFLAHIPEWLLETTGFFILICMVYFLHKFMTQSSANITGTVALFAVSFFRILPAIHKIVRHSAKARNFIPFAQNGLNYLEELEKIGTCKPEESKKQEAAPALLFEKSIDIRQLCFRYQMCENDVLKDVNFTITKGKTIGIIGTSGAGKSTLVDMIIGLLSPTTGDITVDNIRLTIDNLFAWRQHIGYVPQTPYICDGTLAENVAFGLTGDDIDRQRIENCCRMAAMQELMNELPHGIDSLIGERGTKLSGGQRQRVAIARALYNYPDIMIFDEATSSLDQQSERAILQTIYSFKGKQTLIIIAHRLSTVENCDQIIWLDHGRIRRIDTPENILPDYRREMKTSIDNQSATQKAIA